MSSFEVIDDKQQIYQSTILAAKKPKKVPYITQEVLESVPAAQEIPKLILDAQEVAKHVPDAQEVSKPVPNAQEVAKLVPNAQEVAKLAAAPEVVPTALEVAEVVTAAQEVAQTDVLITKALAAIKSLAPSYIYEPKKAIKKRMMKVKKGICPALLAIWTNATTILSPVQRSTPSSSVNYPTVDWSTVNQRFLSNIPAPVKIPIHGCFENAEGYETIYERTDYGAPMNMGSKFTQEFPFGSALGFLTDAGPINVPEYVFHGYKYEASHGWILHAQFPEKEARKKLRTNMGRKTRPRRQGG